MSDEALRPVSQRLGLASALIKNKGDNTNKKAVPSAYEAFVAAVYLDGGLEAARKFALSTLTPLPNARNYIAEVQELLQSRGEELPEYKKILGGTAHSPEHSVTVEYCGKTFNGRGDNFAEAKRRAAEELYKFLEGGI